jgi:large subunit ribosomal protein L10
MNKQEKQQTVDSLNEQFRAINSAFLIDYKGLKVVDATELRRKVREIDGAYVVVKNTLALRAAKDTPLAPLEPHFQGPTALAYHRTDIVALAKLLTEVTRTNPSIQFKAALVEGKLAPSSEIQAIASMPPREVLIGKLAYLVQAPLQRLAMTLKSPLRDLALVLNQIKKEGGQQVETQA